MINMYFKTQEEDDEGNSFVVFLKYIPGEKSGDYAIAGVEEAIVNSDVAAGNGILYETQDAMEADSLYAKLRQKSYPTITDQLDDLYHNGIEGWKATIKAIKDANPKL